MNTLLTTPEERTPSPRKHESTATDPRPSAHPRPPVPATARPVRPRLRALHAPALHPSARPPAPQSRRIARLPNLLLTYVTRVIREDPAGAVVVRAWPGHRNIGRGSCRSALADGVSNAGQQQWCGGYPCTPDGGPMVLTLATGLSACMRRWAWPVQQASQEATPRQPVTGVLCATHTQHARAGHTAHVYTATRLATAHLGEERPCPHPHRSPPRRPVRGAPFRARPASGHSAGG